MMMKRIAVLLLAGFAAAAVAQPAARPPVGLPKDAKLFNGKWYAVILEKTNWHAAQGRCKQRGGQLAVVEDEATQGFIKALTNLRVWLGATDEKVEGKWIWSNGTEMTFTNWASGEPNNREGREQFLRTGADGKWVDHPKEWDAYAEFPVVGYICEWPAAK